MGNRNKGIQILSSSGGFTLPELMVTIAIDGILAIVVVAILIMNVQSMKKTKESIEIESQQSLSFLLFQDALSSAINVDFYADPAGPAITGIGTGRGRVRAYRSRLDNAVAAPVVVGAFLYEVGKPRIGMLEGELSAAAIFFQNPTPTTAGVLSISTSNAAGAATLSSMNPADRFDQIVEFEIRSDGYPAYNRLTGPYPAPFAARSVEIRMVMRKFLTDLHSEYRWCPVSDKARPDCQSPATFNDVTRIIRINLRNNVLEKDGPRPSETIFGDIYFYSPVVL